MAGLIREQLPLADGTITPNRVSLRSRGARSTSRRWRASRPAAVTSRRRASRIPAAVDEIRSFIVAEIAAQLAEPAA